MNPSRAGGVGHNVPIAVRQIRDLQQVIAAQPLQFDLIADAKNLQGRSSRRQERARSNRLQLSRERYIAEVRRDLMRLGRQHASALGPIPFDRDRSGKHGIPN